MLNSSFPLGMMKMIVRINLQEKRTLLGNKLDERDYSEGKYSVGERCSAEDFNDNSAGDSVVMLCWGF